MSWLDRAIPETRVEVLVPPSLRPDPNEEDVVHAGRTAMFTHRETSAHQGTEFFARVVFRIIHKGLTAREAIDEVAKESPPFVQSKVDQAKRKVAEAVDPTTPLSKEVRASRLHPTTQDPEPET